MVGGSEFSLLLIVGFRFFPTSFGFFSDSIFTLNGGGKIARCFHTYGMSMRNAKGACHCNFIRFFHSPSVSRFSSSLAAVRLRTPLCVPEHSTHGM
jgi:hypothetical protein